MTELVSLDGGSIDDVLVLTQYKQDNGNVLGNMVRYWCESCGSCGYSHEIGVHRVGEAPYGSSDPAHQYPSWEWNGDLRVPILQPSQLSRTYFWPDEDTDPAGHREMEALSMPYRPVNRGGQGQPGGFEVLVNSRFGQVCHTYIGCNGAPPGHIVWLGDCRKSAAHPEPAALCGQVRPLPSRKNWGHGDEFHVSSGRSWAKVAVDSGS